MSKTGALLALLALLAVLVAASWLLASHKAASTPGPQVDRGAPETTRGDEVGLLLPTQAGERMVDPKPTEPVHQREVKADQEAAQTYRQTADDEALIEGLLRLEASYRNSMPSTEVVDGFNLVTGSVAAILQKLGRADPGSPEEIQKRGLSLRATSDDEWVFASGPARFRFRRGEFPVYDEIRGLYEQAFSGQNPVRLEPETRADIDALLQEALVRLGAPNVEKR